MSRFPTKPLGEMATLLSGGTPRKTNAELWEGNIPWLTPKDMGRWTGTTEETVAPVAIGKGTKLAPAGASFVAVRGMSLHTEIRVVRADHRMTFNQDIKAIIANDEVDPVFLYYALVAGKPQLFEWVSSAGHGTGVLDTDRLRSLPVPVASKAEQAALGGMFRQIDEKIELNRRKNETLAAMAQAVFRDWFVDFGPVRRKLAGETDPVAVMGGLIPDPARAAELAALFPASFEDDGQPQEWESATLADLAILCKGSIDPLAHPSVEFEHYSLPAFDSGQEPAIDLGADIKSNKTPVPEGAVLLSKLNPEIPRIWLPNPPSVRQQIASTEFLIFQPLPGAGRGLLYCLFRDPTVRQILAGMVTGTSKSHQRISPPALMKTTLLIGGGKVFEAFDQFAEPLLQRVLSLRAENRTLAETRDYLLPRLMSGIVRVGDAPVVESTQ